jgi:serine/threonine protein kinase
VRPSSFGRYRIETELGVGRFSETYHAYDLVRRRPTALKLLHPNLFSDERSWRGFLAEIQRAAELVHPHIAWIWETGEMEGRYFLAERFIGGETLAARLAHSGPLPVNQTLKVLEQIAQAIDFAEQRGWTHGRVTPGNILLSQDLGAVLGDYGLLNAVRLKLPNTPVSPEEAQYLPPEVLHGSPITPRTDLYALACTLVEALTGKSPFIGESQDETLAKKSSPFESPLISLEIIPLQASRVIERALNPEPASRHKYALDFVDELEGAVRLGLTEPAARLQHEEQLRRWRDIQEQGRIEAEEASRLAAVEQARREIQERAHREAEQIIVSQETPVIPEPVMSETRVSANRRKSVSSAIRLPLLALIGAVLLIALGLGGYWLSGLGTKSGGLSTSSTPIMLQTSLPSPTDTHPAPTFTSTPQPTYTTRPTSTVKPSASPTFSRTPTTSLTSTSPPPTSSSTPQRPDIGSRTGNGD